MRLHKFNKNKSLTKLKLKRSRNKNIKIASIVLSVVILFVGIIYFTFARYETTQEYNLIDESVGDFSGDYKLAFYLDDVKQSSIPSPNSNISFSSITCNKGSATFDVGSWNTLVSTNENDTKCKVYFVTNNNAWQLPGGVDLYDGMTPIKFVDGKIYKVSDTNQKWYDYNNHEWANAAILTATGAAKSATQELDPSTDIYQMYVWIPRYAYKLWTRENNQSSEQMINIIFESNTEKDENGYITHPSFTFGTTELNGFWVGKFETSSSTGIQTTANQLCSAEGCSTAANFRILPNMISATNNNVFNMYNASRTIESNSTFGLTASQVDTHMMKNTEWGAVAYLSQSRYGVFNYDETCANSSQAADSTCKVFINNINVGYGNDSTHDVSFQWGPTVTGCSAPGANTGVSNTHNQTNPTCASNYTWDTNGVLASTTGNMSGVYDMSGGTVEYVMGNMANSTTTYSYNAKSSGLSTQPEDKYLDHYLAAATDTSIMSDNEQAKVQNRGILGDATSEVIKTYGSLTGGWNSDYAGFVSSSYPWIGRGGPANGGSDAGVFAFSRVSGGAFTNASFHVVLSAQ